MKREDEKANLLVRITETFSIEQYKLINVPVFIQWKQTEDTRSLILRCENIVSLTANDREFIWNRSHGLRITVNELRLEPCKWSDLNLWLVSNRYVTFRMPWLSLFSLYMTFNSVRSVVCRPSTPIHVQLCVWKSISSINNPIEVGKLFWYQLRSFPFLDFWTSRPKLGLPTTCKRLCDFESHTPIWYHLTIISQPFFVLNLF